MELLYDLVMNIYYNLYSYSIYIIIGIAIYLSVIFLHLKLKLNEKVTKIIIILLAMFLPICSCVSITFLLYEKIVKDEKIIIALYLLSVFFNISAMILIIMYIGNVALIMYILMLFITLIVILNTGKDYYLKKNNENKQYTMTFFNELNDLSNFVFIHFIGILIMSVMNILFKSVQYIDILNDDKNILLLFFDNVMLNYLCIPNDIQNVGKFIYNGYSILLIMPMLFISIIINIPELLLLLSRIKRKIKLIITIILSSSLISFLFLIFVNNDMIEKISINYDGRLYKVAGLFNINPNNFFRIISIIIYILLLLYYSQKKRRVKVMKSRVLSICLVLSMSLMLFSCGDSGSQTAIKQDTAKVNPLAKTPYSDGPDTIENIVKKLVANYNLPELSEEDKNYEINMGYYNCDHMTAGPIGEFAGIYKALGMNVKLTGNANVPAAMQAGQMDIAYCGWTTTLSAVQKGVPLFIAAENHIGGAEYLVVRKGIDMSNPENLYGKSVSFGTDPETTNLNWAEWTTKLGLDRDSSKYEGVAMKDAEEYTAMKAGHLDAYICCDPWGTMAQYSNGKDIESVGNIIIRQDTDRTKDGLGHGTCCKVAMNYNFVKEHPRLAERLLLAHTITLQFCYEHPYLASLGFSAYYNVPVKVALENFWRKFVNEGRTLRWDLNVDYMRNQLNTMKHYGIRDDINTVNVEDYVDLQYFNNSGAINFEEFIKKNIDPVFPETQDWETYNKVALAIDGINESDIPEYVTLDDLKLIK